MDFTRKIEILVILAVQMISGWGTHCDIVNPRLFELQVAEEILADVYDIPLSKVNE